MSYLFLLAYLFCTIIRPQDWVPGLYGVPLISVLALGCLMFLLIERLATKAFEFIDVPQNWFMFFLFGSVLMSHVANTYFMGLVNAFKDFLVIFLLFLIVQHGINNELKFKFAVWFLVGATIVLVPQGIYQLQNGYGWAGQPITYGYTVDDLRINWVGIFNDPNDLALLFVVAVGILIAFIFCSSNYLQKLFIIPFLGLLFYGIYLTNSRGGILALMATTFFFFVRKTRKFLIGGVVGGAAAAAIFVFGPSRMEMLSTADASAYNRIEIWYQGIVMLKTHPLFGVGYNMFTDALPKTAHNSYVLAAAELGLVGLFFWMALIYVSLKQLSIVQLKMGNNSLATYAYGLQAGLVGFCSAAFFLSRTYIIIPYMLFALSGSLFYIAKGKNPDIDFKLIRRDYFRIGWMTIGILGITYTVLKIGL